MRSRFGVLGVIFTVLLIPQGVWSQNPDPAKPLELRGKIDSVTVYRGQALISRIVEVPAGAGLLEIVVTDLPIQVVPNSLFAEATDGAQVRSVLFRERAVAQDVREEVRKMDTALRDLGDQIQANQRSLQTLGEQRAYLDKLSGFVAPTAQAEMTKGVLNAETLKNLTAFQFEQRTAIANNELKLQKEARDLNEQLQTLQRQRNELTGTSAKTVREAVVFANLPEKAGKLRLQYLVASANWFPSYNVRGDQNAKQVTLEYNASIQQMSGEDWTDVKMILSTATPNLIAMAPVLDPLAISLQAGQPGQPGGSVSYHKSVEELYIRQQSLTARRNRGDSYDGSGNLNFNGTMMNQSVVGQKELDQAQEKLDRGLQDVARDMQFLELIAKDTRDRGPVRVRPSEETVSVTYQLANATSLPSRQDTQLIQIASMPVAAEFYKLAAPVLSGYVYDQATLTNNGKMVLLAGPVASYLSGQFVGSGQIPTVALGEAFDVGFGIDSSLRATRELSDKTESTQGGNKVMNFTYRLTIENFGQTAATVRLTDRLPITKDNDVRITLSPKEAAKAPQHDVKKGLLRWDVPIEPQAIDSKAVAIDYQFRLEFDRQMTIAGLPDNRR